MKKHYLKPCADIERICDGAAIVTVSDGTEVSGEDYSLIVDLGGDWNLE